MNFIWIVILALLGLLVFGVASQTTGSSQECMLTSDNVERCSPEMIDDGSFQLPSEGAVIRAVVNNGPVAPDSREGYEIEVGSDGVVVITVTNPEGNAAGDPLEVVTNQSIGESGVQSLLADLNNCGIFYLPQRSEFNDSDLPDGGSISSISIHLADGDWEVLAAHLDGMDQSQFESCQSTLAEDLKLATQ